MKGRLLLLGVLLCAAACGKGGSPGEGTSTSTGITCTPDPDYPTHPGCVEFVHEDGRSEVQPIHQVPSSIGFVDGQPVVKVVHTGQSIIQEGVGGKSLMVTTLATPSRSAQPTAAVVVPPPTPRRGEHRP